MTKPYKIWVHPEKTKISLSITANRLSYVHIGYSILSILMLTSPCNVDPPYTPLLYSKSGVYKGIQILIFAKKQIVGTP